MNTKIAAVALASSLACAPSLARNQPQKAPGSVDDGSVRISERLVGEDDYPTAGVDLGQGWDSYLGQRTQQRCIEVSTTPGALAVFQARASFVDLYDREQLFREMKMSAKASYAGVSGRASFSQSVKIDSKNRNIHGKVFVNNGGSFVVPAKREDGIKLTNEALVLLKEPKTRDEFKRRCGDSFVTAIHNGGRYDAVFSLQETSKEIIERMKLSIKGSYGGFSGSASASSLLKKNSTNEKLSVETNQSGGQPGIVPAGVAVQGAPAPAAPTAGGGAYTVDNIIKKISEFEMMDPERYAKPYAISLESYKVASNYPKELLNDELYANNLLELSANVWRYRELADLYSTAAAAASGFYFPFTSDFTSGGSRPNEKLTIRDLAELSANKASLLYSISNCFDGLVAVCASRSSCKVSDVFSAPFLNQSCPQAFSNGAVWASIRGVGESSEADYKKVLAEASTSTDPALKKLVAAGSIDGLLKDINKAVSVLISKAPAIVNAPPAPSPPPPSKVLSDVPPEPKPPRAGDVPVFSPAEVYYSLLAEAPMRRGPLSGEAPQRPAATDTDDQFNHVIWLCAAYENKGVEDCSTFSFPDVAVAKPPNGPAPDIDHGQPKVRQAAALFRQWVTNERLMPLTRTYCVDPGHLMCLSPDRVLLIANSLPVTFGWERNFATTPPPPPPAVVTPVKPEPYVKERVGAWLKHH
ncbi:MAG: hypothetical protein HY856_10625 [Burkholderiales bacterium]|nr:hypothetical protein [Burkholderiales bacterium]